MKKPFDFATYKAQIDDEIASHSEVLKSRFERNYGLEVSDTFDAYLNVLSRGGKRLRGALGSWAYYFAGGEDESLALQLARVLEMMHAYLLVVDDIADEASVRRGDLSAHKLLEVYHQDQEWYGDGAHYGISQAMNVALLGLHLAEQELAELPVNDTIKLELLRELNQTLARTVIGQIRDINHQSIREVNEKEVMAMMEQKTAYYSFVSPLQLGIILAGGDSADYPWLEDWARNIGISFQIQDDILGVFGDDEKTGKSHLDDIKEGKMTLLVTRTLTHATETQKQELLSRLGDTAISEDQISEIKDLMEKTGALQYCQELAELLAKKAIDALQNAPARFEDDTSFLVNLTRTIVSRAG